MFTLKSEPTFKHKVTARVPIDGGFKNEEFAATFKVLPVSEMAQFDLTDGASSTEFLRKVVTHLDDIADPSGTAVEYSDELRDQVIGLPYARVALVMAYHSAVAGAALGN